MTSAHERGVLTAVGVDGCKAGWIAALCGRQPTGEWATSLKRFDSIVDLASWRDGLADEPLVTIDVPIGVPDVVGFRRCDEEARALLGSRRDVVFMTPGRYLLGATNFDEARRLVKERRSEKDDTKGLSAQAAGLLPKIREVDEFVRARADYEQWLFEVHPEVCFRLWAGRDLPAKRSAAGMLHRLDLVRGVFPDAEPAIRRQPFRPHELDLTDILDAYAALWTALRKVRGQHRVLGREALNGITASMIV